MLYPLLVGYVTADLIIGGTAIEIRQFKDERHIEEIASAFQLELAANETLYVAGYHRGALQARMSLRVVIENVESVESFISRFNGGLEEIPIDSEYYTLWLPSGTFRAYDLDIFCLESTHRDFHSQLSLFYDGDKINAEFLASGGTPPELRNVANILVGYLPSIWLYPFFLVPLVMQAALIIFIVVRVVRRKKEIARMNINLTVI
jgi:hypothetical protein